MENLIIILNIILLETLVSIDNAAVLAYLVKDLPPVQQPKALRYGLIGAFVFRGISLFIVSWLIKIMWLKIIGGCYLVWICIKEIYNSSDALLPSTNYNFWKVVIMVEVMDLAFSIDNVFAAVALTPNIYLIITGVFIGILAMRFVAGYFIKLIERKPYLRNAIFIIIFLLGVKLIFSGITSYLPDCLFLNTFLNSHPFDLAFSLGMIVIFLISFFKPIKNI